MRAEKILVCCPSYRRPDRVETLKYLPFVTVFVAESELIAYNRGCPKGTVLAPMPDKVQGNIARVRNWILDNSDADVICIVDDDLQFIARYEKDEQFKIQGDWEFFAFLAKYTDMARDLGTPLWGINVNMDKQCYREYTPFSMTSVVLAPFMVHLNTQIRFDETMPLKEDYDFCLQTLNQHRKILRVNKYHYLTRQGGSKTGAGQTGGCAAMRTVYEERRQMELLQQKWGDRIVQLDTLENSRSHSSSKVKNFDVNPIVRIPIAGV